tara:strand:- start:618 stop:887 length:270 start_codon:yes stop_codon:yes gene_type:complete
MSSGAWRLPTQNAPQEHRNVLGRFNIHHINHQANDVGELPVGGFHESLEVLKREHDLFADILEVLLFALAFKRCLARTYQLTTGTRDYL